MQIEKVISGGQTGADRAALDVALEANLCTGGFVPHGRLAEDGRIPAQYGNLQETESSDPRHRTRANVLAADATLIFSYGAPIGGTAYTAACAEESGKPYLLINLGELTTEEILMRIRRWLEPLPGGTINVAGARHSEDPNLYTQVAEILRRLLKQGKVNANRSAAHRTHCQPTDE